MGVANLDAVQASFFQDLGDTASWCQEQYESTFSSYFSETYELYLDLQKERNKLSDEQLEYILTSLPLNLIAVSEVLSQYRLNRDCLKLYIQKQEAESIRNSDLSTVSEKKEQASMESLEYRILMSAYSSIIKRVENEITFSRELIMTAKKIWDSRVKTYEASPVQSNNMLEDFTMDLENINMESAQQ